jgi:hypothetical protein
MGWLVRFAGYLALLTFAYTIAIVGYAAVHWVAAMPGGVLWDESWRAPARFLILLLLFGAMLLPAMRSEAEGSLRSASVLCALMLAAYSSLKISGLADPDIPEIWVFQHLIDPLRHFAGGAT